MTDKSKPSFLIFYFVANILVDMGFFCRPFFCISHYIAIRAIRAIQAIRAIRAIRRARQLFFMHMEKNVNSACEVMENYVKYV